MQNEQHIWNWLTQCSGLNDYGIAAIMGNIEAESGGYPNNVENRSPWNAVDSDKIYTESVDDGTYKYWETDAFGYGLCQWTYSTRKRALLAFAKEKKVSIADLDMQLEFLVKELMNSFSTVWSALVNATNINTPCDIFLEKFENPTVKNYAERRKMCLAIYNRNHGTNGLVSTTTTSSTSTASSTATTTKTATSKCAVSLPVLSNGSTGDGVKNLQAILVQRGYLSGTNAVDGIFGVNTENALKLYQAACKITADGKVGVKTYQKLFS